MPETSRKSHDPYAALRVPDFRLFISCRISITIAIQMQAVIVGWQVYTITKDVFSLGLIGLAEAVPAISVSLIGGHVADRFDRKNIIISVLSLIGIASAGLYLLSLDMLNALDYLGILPIYTLIFIIGIGRGFFAPAVFAFMPQLLPDRKLFNNAITWNSTIWQSAAVAGPAVGGLIYGFAGLSTSYLIICTLLIVAIFIFSFIPSRPLPPKTEKESAFDSLFAGIRFVFKNQLILSAISLDMFAVLFGGAVALLPVFASEILMVGPEGLGLLRSAPAVGAVIMAVAMTHKPLRENAGKKMLLAVAGFGICMIFFALSQNFWISLLILVISGMFDSISVITRQTLMQTFTPDHMKGRVAAVNSIFVGSSNEIGAFESGVAARALGLVPSVVFGGAMTLLVVAVTSWKADKLRKLRFQ